MDTNEQAKEMIRLFSNLEDTKSIYKVFSGMLKYIVITSSNNEDIILPELGKLNLKVINDKVYMSIYPTPECEKFILDCKKAEEDEDFSKSPLYLQLRQEINMLLRSKQ